MRHKLTSDKQLNDVDVVVVNIERLKLKSRLLLRVANIVIFVSPSEDTRMAILILRSHNSDGI